MRTARYLLLMGTALAAASARSGDHSPPAQACTPGMSCFGKIVLLPNGEVAEAAAAAAATAATATATANAMSKAKKDADAKATEKADAKAKTKEKRKVTCERRGASERKLQTDKLKCRYSCPGDPAGAFREVFLDVLDCPPFWYFWL